MVDPASGGAVGRAAKLAIVAHLPPDFVHRPVPLLPRPPLPAPPLTPDLALARRRSEKPSSREAAAEPGWLARLWLPAGLFLLGLWLGFAVPYVWAVDRWLQHEFGRLSWQIPTRIYARPLPLAPGMALTEAALEAELAAAGYRSGDSLQGAGSYAKIAGSYRIASRGFRDLDGALPPRAIELKIAKGRVGALTDPEGRPLEQARLDPARIATVYGDAREERRLVRLEDVPPLLIGTLQAVEDRSFKDHAGIDWKGIARAFWVNLRHGEVRQGGSTLTQQLVRNLYLGRQQHWDRKFREAVYAIVMEARFDKRRILEVYLNQVYLGQQGGQAVHGVGAGAEFWFGRELEQLGPGEIALLVGLIQGPSLHDPRRHPERAIARRARVLEQMVETGLLEASIAAKAARAPLGVSAAGSLSANRYPAFVELVREQLATDYPADALRGAGLTVLSTLVPAAQQFAERAVIEQLAALQPKQPPLQAALVLTDTGSGEVVAMVGGVDPRDLGFNRALAARRPVGSLLKPFVYLLALAQPGRWSLASYVYDEPITLRVSGGRTWTPENIDKQSQGEVVLADALATSRNQATVRLGVEIGVDRLSRLIDALLGFSPPAHPSLLLGAVDLTPLQMARLYQFIASGGQVQPLRAVRGVLGADGRALHRYDEQLEPAQAGDAIATRLVTMALQQAAASGTARRLQADGLGWLKPAGKTGTSNDSRDSWFAGWSGGHLAVVWIGNDGNLPTALNGATGAMRVWSALFRQLPTEPLKVSGAGLEWAWVDAERRATDSDCPGARQFAFVAGYAPVEFRGCSWQRVRGWFRGD
jgi:penicillin-binding protein 1B